MIWLFEFDDKFWGDKSKVDRYYLFNENDISFDINLYDITLYMGRNNYFLLNDTNHNEIYYLEYSGPNSNPSRKLLGKNTDYYNVIQNYYIDKSKQK